MGEFCRLASEDGGPAVPLVLPPWQAERVIRPLFGWRRPDGRLRYRRGALFVPKKNAKSSLMAAVCQFLMTAHFPIADVYPAAVDRDQARIIFRMMARSVRASPVMDSMLEVVDSKSIIRNRIHGNELRCLSADGFRAEGLNGSVVIDEIHAHRSDKLISALMYATRATKNGVVLAISTAGDDRNSVGFQWWRDCELVMADPAANPSFFGLIYGAKPDDPRGYGCPEVWREANPSMGITFPADEFEADYQDARTDPRKFSRWLRYSLNVWTEADGRLFDPDDVARCVADPPEPLEGRQCWGGLDIADLDDLTAAAFVFRSDDGTIDVDLIAWTPAAGLAEREKKHGIPYSAWVAAGWLRTTEGQDIDLEKVAADVIEYSERHEVREIGGDPWHLSGVGPRLEAEGLTVRKVPQRIGYLTSPTKKLLSLVKAGKVRFRSPVLLWCMNNTEVWEDPNGNIRPDKAKSKEKIDAAMATVIAFAVESTDVEPEDGGFVLTVV